ncbi:hypothetical protein CERSUDRAFT_77086 [Gelatoporia subvermispora B]|uniref:Uncharacterized protein n=1 Tax=Ceriporiopsis subvermispora (strain B) TaxID=914234 RepID=M2QKM4_CERS8|nr:hypothetical protein CERSUDRAFT_77086 [Gelatoporia subvermispora B]
MSVAPGTFGRSDVPPLDNTMGAMLVGVLLWGITCAQAYHYYTASAVCLRPLRQLSDAIVQHYDDRGILRMIVLTTFLLDTSHQALVCHTIYTYLITWYNNPLNLLRVVWSLEAQIPVTVFHMESLALNTYGMCLIFFQSLTYGIQYFTQSPSTRKRYDSFLDIGRDISYAYTLGAVGVAANVAISASLILLLFTSRACLPTTNHIIQRLIIFNITTGLPASGHEFTLDDVWLFCVLNIRQRLRDALPCTVALENVQFATVTNEANTSRVLMTHNNMGMATEVLSNVGI